MKKFILLSFGFLAFAFYEMSGGAGFDPEAIKMARIDALEAQESVISETAAKSAPVIVAKAPKVFVDTDPPETNAVTRVALNLTSIDDLPQADTPRSSDVSESVQPVTVAVPQNVGTVTSSADTPPIIPSLIAPSDGMTTTTEVVTSYEDIRTVSGNRVNVRGGPGTDFGVVARLVRGDEVKVLEDNGDGWVRFETVNGGTGGWMADFLLIDG
ncbi:SH3 domain-containing protein [Sulfitobacter sp. JBTF-M27]|uniref:SH3 domain-containing protein n=1 Tax=Sulfitobacter sediminilitoris TaxID=2698830 RepID=A0A6P0CEW1_9RHOB|nr:SH3 domain-containing protein [Sulfitobacter sediminilitoris]NEK23013.1 SH3 domain-containing protein [Sulfitobacter sediminilitoris]